MNDTEILLKQFLSPEGKLKTYPSKLKMRNIAALYLSSKFEEGKAYTEKEVNMVIENWTTFSDPASLRREMYNFGFFDRKPDGSEYSLKADRPDLAAVLSKYNQ